LSDVKSFRYSNDESWKEFRRSLEDEGRTIEEFFTSQVNQRVALNQDKKTDDDDQRITRTASKCTDDLREEILLTHPAVPTAIEKGKIHITLNTDDHKELIERAEYTLRQRLNTAAHNAIYEYWTNQIAVTNVGENLQAYIEKHKSREDLTLDQAIQQEKFRINQKQVKFAETIEKTVNVTFECPVIPQMTLSNLTERHIGEIVSLECTVIGPGPRKLDTTNEKYVQKILIQELESQAKNNNPMVMKCVLHGDDTKYITSGQRKRIIGKYRVEATEAGKKATNDKALLIDAFAIWDIEDTQEVELSPKELQTAREFAHARRS